MARAFVRACASNAKPTECGCRAQPRLHCRYKRDEIGVFELKEYVESLQAAVEKHQTDSKSRAGSLNDGIESLGAAVSATQELLAARDKEQNNITSFVLDQLNLQDERLRSLLEAANGAVDPLLVDEAYWLAIAGAVIPKDSPARRISVLGVGFGACTLVFGLA